MKKILIVLLIGILIGILAMITVQNFAETQPTSFITVSEGSVTSVGEHAKPNQNFGAIKGTVRYTITDPDTGNVISSEPGAGVTIYIIPTGKTIEGWSNILETKEAYNGQLTDVDADGTNSLCSKASYTTSYKYYDKNSNAERNGRNDGEFDVYTVTTDSNGCFAMKLPIGEYDIYV